MYWREHPTGMAAFEKVRYSWLCTSMTGSTALMKSRCFFLRASFALVWHCSEQYFCIPLLTTNSFPQNAHFLVVFILMRFWWFYTRFVYLHRFVNHDALCSTYVNSFRIVTILEDMTASLSSLVHSCQPLSTESAKWQKKLLTFSAVEIRCKFKRKIGNHQISDLKC